MNIDYTSAWSNFVLRRIVFISVQEIGIVEHRPEADLYQHSHDTSVMTLCGLRNSMLQSEAEKRRDFARNKRNISNT